VILIDASIFDSDEEEEEVQPVKRIRSRKPLKEPHRRAEQQSAESGLRRGAYGSDRRTRFRRDPDLVYSDDDDYEEEQPVYDEHEPEQQSAESGLRRGAYGSEQKYGFRGMRHIPEQQSAESGLRRGAYGSEQDYPEQQSAESGLRRGAYGSDENIRTTFDQINRGAGSRSANVQPPPPIRNHGVALEQIKNENPLARMIFG